MITIDDDPAVLEREPVKVKLICLCGHAEARHITTPRGSTCDALKGNCPCRRVDLALKVSDARVFMYSPQGDAHPLVAGIIKLKQRGGEWSWVGGYGHCTYIPPGMGMCNKPMKIAKYIGDGERTVLACEEHVGE